MKARLLAVLALLVPLSAIADKPANKVALTLAGGAGFAGDPSSGDANIDIDAKQTFQIVANIYDRQNEDGANLYYEFFLGSNTLNAEISPAPEQLYETSVDAYHLQVGGVYEWTPGSLFRPYLAATLGLSHYSPEYNSEESFFSGSLGLGGRFWVSDSFALRLEARAFGTVMDSSSEIFCQDNVCAVEISGSLWLQQQLTAGVTWSF